VGEVYPLDQRVLRKHPHPSPPPQAGEGAHFRRRDGFFHLSRLRPHAGEGAHLPRPQPALIPEPPGQCRNEAVGVEFIVEDMGRDAHTIKARRDIDAFARKSVDQP